MGHSATKGNLGDQSAIFEVIFMQKPCNHVEGLLQFWFPFLYDMLYFIINQMHHQTNINNHKTSLLIINQFEWQFHYKTKTENLDRWLPEIQEISTKERNKVPQFSSCSFAAIFLDALDQNMQLHQSFCTRFN